MTDGELIDETYAEHGVGEVCIGVAIMSKMK